MRILRVISSADTKNGGPINGVVNSSSLMASESIEVTVISLDGEKEECNRDGVRYVSLQSSFGKLKYSSGLKRWLFENINQYDAVIIHGVWQLHSYVTAKVCKKFGVPYYIFTHGMLDPWFIKGRPLKRFYKKTYWYTIESFVLKNCERIFYTSLLEKKVSDDEYSLDKEKGIVVSYGCPDLFKNSSVSEKSNSNDDISLLFLGRIHEKKGLSDLFHALSNLNSDILSRITLKIAGPESAEKDKLCNMAKKLRIEEKISWLGMLEGSKKVEALSGATAFILPSHQENFGISVAEALSMSLPVLITNKVYIYDVIEQYKCGLVSVDDSLGLLEMIREFSLKDQAEVLVMRERSRDCYLNNFSIESSVAHIMSVLRKEC